MSKSQLCATNRSPAVSQLNGSSPGCAPVAAIDSPIARCHQASGSTCGRHVATHAADEHDGGERAAPAARRRATVGRPSQLTARW